MAGPPLSLETLGLIAAQILSGHLAGYVQSSGGHSRHYPVGEVVEESVKMAFQLAEEVLNHQRKRRAHD